MARLICKNLGVVFITMGVVGFFAPGMLGAHLSVAHNIIHLISGLLAAWFGWRSPYQMAKNFCLTFGSIYGLLGIAGLFAGPGVPMMPGMQPSNHLLTVIPGMLELGTVDSVGHLIIGALFLWGGLSKPRLSELPPTKPDQVTREKIGIP